MKALFFKEVRQGKMILFFGPCFGLLLLLLARGLLALFTPWQKITLSLFIVGLGGTLLIALLCGAGLFAGEVERGTLPLILSLPLSRKKVWGAKTLAGLVLGLVASILLLLLISLPFYQQLSESLGGLDGLSQMLLAWICCWFAVFFVGLLFSNLWEHTISVILTALLFCIGLSVLAAYVVYKWGGSLWGHDPLSDAGLWLAALTPALLLASLMAFRRGELLQGRRKWLAALPVFVLVAGFSVLIIIGSLRWSLHYLRSQVQTIYPINGGWNGSTIALQALRSPVSTGAISPSGDLKAAFQFILSQQTGNYISSQAYELSKYRSQNLVLLDLETGQERLVVRNGQGAALSGDGQRALVLSAPFALTWLNYSSRYNAKPDEFAIFDLTSGRQTQQGSTETFQYHKDVNNLALDLINWSPNGSWLAFPSFKTGEPPRLILTRQDGYWLAEISLARYSSWTWELGDKGLYYLNSDACLQRYGLPTGETRLLWNARSALQLLDSRPSTSMKLSPDGRWLALQIQGRISGKTAKEEPNSREYRYGFWILLISSDGRRIYTLQHAVNDVWDRTYASEFVWSADSGKLWYVLVKNTPTSAERALALWRIGENEPTLHSSQLPPGRYITKISLWPTAKKVMLWGKPGVLLADEQGKIRPFPNDKVSSFAKEGYSLLGLDKKGRAIIIQRSPDLATNPFLNWNSMIHLDAVDLNTGELKQLYP